MAIAIVIVAIVVVLLIVGLVLLAQQRARRRRELQEMYGPEYDRAVEQTGSRRAAERELAQRQEQRDQLTIVALSASSRSRYTQAWSEVQGRFVDDPQSAVGEADELVTAVMRERGYPTEGFDEQARLLSVDHTNTLENYRSGHEIAGLARQRQATTEQLRQGMMHYRSLFRELVEDQGDEGRAAGAGQQVAGQQPYPQQGQPQQMPQQPQQFQQGQQFEHGQQLQQQPAQFQQAPNQPPPSQQPPPAQQFQQPAPQQAYPEAPPTAEFRRPTSEATPASRPGPMEQPTTEYQRPATEQFGGNAGQQQAGPAGPAGYPTSPPPSAPPPSAPPEPQPGGGHLGQGQVPPGQFGGSQPGPLQPGQVQPGQVQPGPGQPGEPYPVDDAALRDQEHDEHGGRLRRQAGPTGDREPGGYQP